MLHHHAQGSAELASNSHIEHACVHNSANLSETTNNRACRLRTVLLDGYETG